MGKKQKKKKKKKKKTAQRFTVNLHSKTLSSFSLLLIYIYIYIYIYIQTLTQHNLKKQLIRQEERLPEGETEICHAPGGQKIFHSCGSEDMYTSHSFYPLILKH